MRSFPLLSASLLAALLAGCAGGPPQTAVPADKDVPEIRPGMMAGYLDRKLLPDSRALLPPPPAPGSAAQAADDAATGPDHAQGAAGRRRADQKKMATATRYWPGFL